MSNKLEELKELRYYKSITLGLWATDRPDLLSDEEKEKCHLFEIKY